MQLPTMWALIAVMTAHSFFLGGTAVGAASVDGHVGTDLYEVLHISPSANACEIRTAYRRAVLLAHPDKGGTSEKFHSITSAFNVLSCPDLRQSYDQRRLQVGDHAQIVQRGEKRPASTDLSDSTVSTVSALSRLDQALQRLRDVLQDMPKPLRQELMPSIPIDVQKALKDFMEKSSNKPTDSLTSEERPHLAGSASTRLSVSGNKSKAQLDIEHLRIYTRWVGFETAIDHQVILVEVKDRLLGPSAADTTFWSQPAAVREAFERVLTEKGTTMEELGLSVYVEMRATEWVSNRYHITTPVVPLSEAIALRARLLDARARSWELVRAEWIDLLQRGKNSRSLEDAEAYVDKARRDFLEKRLTNVVGSVSRAIEFQSRTEAKAEAKAKSQQERKVKSRTQKAAEQSTKTSKLSARNLRAHTIACEAAWAKDAHLRTAFECVE